MGRKSLSLFIFCTISTSVFAQEDWYRPSVDSKKAKAERASRMQGQEIYLFTPMTTAFPDISNYFESAYKPAMFKPLNVTIISHFGKDYVLHDLKQIPLDTDFFQHERNDKLVSATVDGETRVYPAETKTYVEKARNQQRKIETALSSGLLMDKIKSVQIVLVDKTRALHPSKQVREIELNEQGELLVAFTKGKTGYRYAEPNQIIQYLQDYELKNKAEQAIAEAEFIGKVKNSWNDMILQDYPAERVFGSQEKFIAGALEERQERRFYKAAGVKNLYEDDSRNANSETYVP